jgi:hypothetical protein
MLTAPKSKNLQFPAGAERKSQRGRRSLMDSRLTGGLTAVVVFLTAVSVWAATTPEQACEAIKIKATGQKAQDKLKCYAKAAAQGNEVEAVCLMKAENAFAFQKAEEKGAWQRPPGANWW